MKLRDMKIGTQLRIGLGSILLLVVLLGSAALFDGNLLWQQQEGLYSHPLTVRRALSDARYDYMVIQLRMKDLVQAGNEREQQAVIQEIDSFEADASRRLAIIYDSYLGPRKDVDDIQDAAVRWKAVRSETIRLLLAGKSPEAASRVKPVGADSLAAAKVLHEFKDVSDFALKKGDQFFANAKKLKNSLQLQLAALLSAVFFLTLFVSYLLLKTIRTPLQELTAAAKQFQGGALDTRSSYDSPNEFGMLSDSFNELAETVQLELLVKENSGRVADAMLQDDELRPFCRELLKELLQLTGSQVGAVYLLDNQNSAFEHFESIGFSSVNTGSFSATLHEGEFGSALATGQIQHISNIPPDTKFTFATVCGQLIPAEILTIPILAEQKVVAMVSLAGLRPYSVAAVRLVNDVWHVITARFNRVLVLEKIRNFSEKLELQNRELESQTREMTAQKDELTEQNVELELQKNQLDEANRLKSAFLSNMSHELRTPLNSVIALSGVLNRRLANAIPDEEYSYLGVIERNGRNLLALINDILDLSRIEAGKEEISLERFSIRNLVSEVVAMLEHQSNEKGIALLNGIDEGLPTILSDYTKCRHILQNLVANAVKFTAEGSVEIHAVQRGDQIRISVTDTGIGIAPNQIDYIFDEFRQADESTTKNYGGTGLGLAIAKKYVTLLKGDITVTSSPGKGSTFTIILPFAFESAPSGGQVRESAEYPGSPRTGTQPVNVSGQGKCILVVEDNDPAVIQLSDILNGQGYCVKAARNGKEALEQVEKSLPDAMILDLMMPEIDGFEVLAAIRSMEKSAHIPVLILTAKHVTREELSFLKGNNIHQLIQKGDINRNELLKSIENMVQPLDKTPPSPARVQVSRRPAGKPVVLVMEDNPDNLLTIRAMLDKTCRVLEASNGQAGLELARAHEPDIILMDLAMPVMDGFKTLHALRNEDGIRHIPVIAVTADAMSGSREKILAHGFDGYLAKPIDWNTLEEAIRETLNDTENTDC
ncbi:MAG: response regulator [Desulfuromonadales bacterium]|nr:response regulator [Desulfuromonadales bacterium]